MRYDVIFRLRLIPPTFRALASRIPPSHIRVMQSDFSIFRGAAAQ